VCKGRIISGDIAEEVGGGVEWLTIHSILSWWCLS